MASLPQRQRVGAYAVMLREHGGRVEVLLSRLAPRVSRTELWTLPGGGVDHGEDPRTAVVREIHEETGLDATVSETAHVYSAHLPRASRDGQLVDAHAIRIVYDGWVAPDAPEPRVVEVDGSTVEAAWKPLDDVVSGCRPDGRRWWARRSPTTCPSGCSGWRRTPSCCAGPATTSRCCSPGSPRAPRTRAGGRCPAAASTTASTRRWRWRARSRRSAGWRARWARWSACTTPTSPATRRPVGSRTTTASTCSTPPPSATVSRRSGRSTAPPTPRPGCPVADVRAGRVEVLDVVDLRPGGGSS